MVRDGALDKKATIGTKREGHGNRTGKSRLEGYESSRKTGRRLVYLLPDSEVWVTMRDYYGWLQVKKLVEGRGVEPPDNLQLSVTTSNYPPENSKYPLHYQCGL